ncbi:MAG TPA: TonB-dependent receptor [Gemmatimonadaceae bacterium]|nr:TonB-dependent receptor [Gemmatimonadaceae bacterium]
MKPLRIPTILLATIAGVAMAQTPEDTVTLAPVTVTATRLPMSRKAAPAAMTVITGEDLRARGITRLTDALREVPGAAVVQSGSFGSQTALFLRGGESDYTKVLIDGVPLNDAGGSIDFAHIAVDDVERIEIVRGPASVLWGSDAVTGVIQIFTTPASRSRLRMSARGGSYATHDANGDVTVARGTVQFSAALASHGTDGVLDFNNGYRNRQASASLRVGPSIRKGLRAMVRHTDATYHYPTDFLGAPVDSNQYRREKRLVAGVDASAPLSERATVRLTLGTNELDGISDNQVDRPGDVAYHDETEASRRLVDGRVDLTLPAEWRLTAGADWTRQHEANTANFEASRINRGYYVQLLAGVGAPWLVTVGTRLDDNEKFGTFTTWRASGSWVLPSETRVRATVGAGFKEPAFAEVFNTSFTRGNAALEPERSRSMELSVEQEILSERSTLAVTWFDQRFRDRIDFIAFPPDSAVFGTFTNIGEAIASGIEVEARAGLVSGLALATSYAYLETEITEDPLGRVGQRLLRRPMHTATATASYANDRGSLSATVHRVGARHDVGYVRLPWYTTLDVAGEVRLMRRPATAIAVTARVENALDERYEAILNYRAPGRTILLGARAELGW